MSIILRIRLLVLLAVGLGITVPAGRSATGKTALTEDVIALGTGPVGTGVHNIANLP